jgi:hypothetical protein
MQNLDVALRCQIVNFSGPCNADYFSQATAVCHISIVQNHFALLVGLWVSVKVSNAPCIEGAGSADDSMHLIAFLEQ